jgi:DNA-binding response OmpR family regulator
MNRDVLVVEDEPDLVATYERLLHRHGYRVVSTGSRAVGLAAIRSRRPLLLITDLRLPDGDGLDVVRAARALPTPTPVIVVTGFGASRAAAMAAGATAFLTKPFSTETFSKLVRSLLETGSC